jgi:hypothetical protein
MLGKKFWDVKPPRNCLSSLGKKRNILPSVRYPNLTKNISDI